MWDEIDTASWKEVPVITGRAATEKDVQQGRAVFYVPSGSEPYEVELPLFAVQTMEDSEEKLACVVIQMEVTPEGTAVGVRYFGGGNGVGMANEFEFFTDIPSEHGT